VEDLSFSRFGDAPTPDIADSRDLAEAYRHFRAIPKNGTGDAKQLDGRMGILRGP
jgi:hypothetical protein